MTNAEKFFDKIKDKKVAFIGIGVSHTDVIRQFAEKGIYTEARDKTDREKLGETAELLEKSGAVLKLGEGYLDDMDADRWNSYNLRTKYYTTRLHKGAFYLPAFLEEMLKEVE